MSEPTGSDRTPMLNALAKTNPTIPKNKREKLSDLPRWVRIALAQKVTLDLSYAEAGAKHSKSRSALEKYGSSPAGQAWMKEVAKTADDPMRLVEAVMQASLMNITADYMMALQMAIESRDYKEIGVICRDILDRQGVTKKTVRKDDGSRAPIILNFGGAGITSMEAPMVESSYEEGEFTVVVDDDDDE